MIRRCVITLIRMLLLVPIVEPCVGMLFGFAKVNDEIRMSNDETMTNDQIRTVLVTLPRQQLTRLLWM
jgi:hypothetical protein